MNDIFVVALLAAFVILLLGKTGARERMRNWCDRNGAGKIADMLECDFCLSFWTCVAVFVIMWSFCGGHCFIVPLCAAPVTRYLI